MLHLVLPNRGTRSCVGRIVVGDPRVLWDDPHWGELLRFCHEHGAYTGSELPSSRGSHDEAQIDLRRSEMEALLHDDGVTSESGSDEEYEVAPSMRMLQEQLPYVRHE
jgi:hypothetical protein